MEIGATLAALTLATPEPAVLAQFYAATFGLQCRTHARGITCSGRQRTLELVPGEAGRLRGASLRFHDDASMQRHRARLAARGLVPARFDANGYTIPDPLGHELTFLAPTTADAAGRDAPTTGPTPARLQHFALRTPAPEPLAGFYVEQLGFVVSDRVLDDDGDLTAIFLRTDAEHHAMAIFRAPLTRFDHFSCEVEDWVAMRDWADHMARAGVELAWGVGRHGPGNDTFLMVRDRDGNMGEISAELETCLPGRPAGTWPHRPQTLNQWGVALMRS